MAPAKLTGTNTVTTHRDGDLCFECDECGALREFAEGADFLDSWTELKEDEGWRCSKKGGQWKHFCRRCVYAWVQEQRAPAGDDDPPWN